jgi:hypothetical protein
LKTTYSEYGGGLIVHGMPVSGAALAAYDREGLTRAVAAQAMPANMEGLDIRVASPKTACSSAPRKMAFADILRDPPAREADRQADALSSVCVVDSSTGSGRIVSPDGPLAASISSSIHSRLMRGWRLP